MEPVGPAYPQTGNVPDVHPSFPTLRCVLIMKKVYKARGAGASVEDLLRSFFVGSEGENQ